MPKIGCIYCPPNCKRAQAAEDFREREQHPSWTAGMQALEDYNHWVNAIVLPIAFQWIEEHKAEVYADVPEELKDDIGVAIAAAFKKVKELPLYQRGREQREAYEAARAEGSLDSSKTNPVWTGIAQKAKAGAQEAFAAHAEHLGDTIP